MSCNQSNIMVSREVGRFSHPVLSCHRHCLSSLISYLLPCTKPPLTWSCCFLLSLHCSVIVLFSHKGTDKRTCASLFLHMYHMFPRSGVSTCPLSMCACDLSAVCHHCVQMSTVCPLCLVIIFYQTLTVLQMCFL